MNAYTISHAQLKTILRAIWYTPGLNGRWGLPVVLWGDPGTGKTSACRARATASGLWLDQLIGSVCDPTDFGGVPSPAANGSPFADALLPNWLRKIDERKGTAGVLFLDELTGVPQAVQSAMLGLVLDGAVGDYRISPRVRFVAAANPVDQAAGGQPLAMPTANRFGHLTVSAPDVEDWYAILAGTSDDTDTPLNADAIEAEVLARWDREYARALTLVVGGFLRKFPALAQQTPKAGTPASEGAWASHRTWEMVVRAVAGATIHGLCDDDRDALVAAFVGIDKATAFAAWLRDADLPDAADLLDGKVQWAPSPYRPDRTQCILDLCAGEIAKGDAGAKVSRARVLWKLLSDLCNAGTPDLGLSAIKVLSLDTAVAMLPEGSVARQARLEVLRATGTAGLRS